MISWSRWGVLTGLLLSCSVAFSEEMPAERADPRPGEPLAQRISLDLERASLRDAVNAVIRSTGFRLMAADAALDRPDTVTIKIQNAPIGRVLDFLSACAGKDTRFDFDPDLRVLIVAPRVRAEEKRKTVAPEYDHKKAMKTITEHSQIKDLLKERDDVRLHVRWAEEIRAWVGNLTIGEGGREPIGRVVLREFDEGEPRITDVELNIPLRLDQKDKVKEKPVIDDFKKQEKKKNKDAKTEGEARDEVKVF